MSLTLRMSLNVPNQSRTAAVFTSCLDYWALIFTADWSSTPLVVALARRGECVAYLTTRKRRFASCPDCVMRVVSKSTGAAPGRP